MQQAFIDEQAVQCGYCINGMIMQSAAFLATNKKPSEARDQGGARQQSLPLRHACPHRRARSSARPQCVREAIMNDSTLTRRDFLKGGGALVVSFSLRRRALARGAGPGAPRPSPLDEVDGFLAIDADGNVTVYSGKVDLGTGVAPR